MNAKEFPLSNIYFTKEFPPDWEVEWKGNLLTLDPAGFIYTAHNVVAGGYLEPFVLPKSLGKLSLELRFFNLYFHYYGHEEDRWIEDFVLAQPPGSPIFIPRIKKYVVVQGLNPEAVNVIIRQERKEDRKSALHPSQLQGFIQTFEKNRGIKTQFVGSLRRERYSFYIHNKDSRRNWSLLADICQPIDPFRTNQLAQVEFEYKGIDGISPRNLLSQQAVLVEAGILSGILIEWFGDDILQPTSLTKFEWLLQQRRK